MSTSGAPELVAFSLGSRSCLSQLRSCSFRAVLIADWHEIIGLPWENYLPIIPLILILHFLSTAAQLFVWLLIISHVRRIDRRDLQIFSSMLLVRYLPGTAWNILGRITTYVSVTKTEASAVWAGTLVETTFLLLTGVGLATATLDSLDLFLKISRYQSDDRPGNFAYSRMGTDESRRSDSPNQ